MAQAGESMMRTETEIKERLEKMNLESATTEVGSFDEANNLLGFMDGLKWALGGAE